MRIALLSNPKSSANIAKLSQIREYCAEHPDVFHFEIEHASQIGEAMRSIAKVRPKVLAINGGDATVKAALTELCNGGHFGDRPPAVAVLPLGARAVPAEILERLIALARDGRLADQAASHELIALRQTDRPGISAQALKLAGKALRLFGIMRR